MGDKNVKAAFRVLAKQIRFWYLDVTIYRVLAANDIFLHGLEPVSAEAKEQLTASAQGQAIAATLFAEQIADTTGTNTPVRA